MPLLRDEEYRVLYETWFAIRPEKGRWLKLIRIPNPAESVTVYLTYEQDARTLRHLMGFSLFIDSVTGKAKVQFSSKILDETISKANKQGLRVIIVDAPLAVGK